jgi:hypothetical protein
MTKQQRKVVRKTKLTCWWGNKILRCTVPGFHSCKTQKEEPIRAVVDTAASVIAEAGWWMAFIACA